MKGSAVVLLGCFAFYTASCYAYSVKFISEDDEIANRQDTESRSHSPDVALIGDAVQSVNSDTVTDESKTIKMEDNMKPEDQSVPGDTPREQSKIRKRDTRSLVRDLMDNVQETKVDVIDKYRTLELFKTIGVHGFLCYQNALRNLEMNELGNESGISAGNQGRFTQTDMVRWLKTIQAMMSDCFREITITLQRDMGLSDSDDSATPILAKPEPERGLVTENEMIKWVATIGQSLNKCFSDIIKFLENKVIWKEPSVPSQISTDTDLDPLADLTEIVSDADGATIDVEDQTQSGPPDHTVPPAAGALPIITHYKRRNYFNKQGVPQYPEITHIPGMIFEDPSPIFYPFPLPNFSPQAPRERRYPAAPEITGFRGEIIHKPFPSIITTFPSDIHDTKKSGSYFSLLDLVLNKIYAKTRGKMPFTGYNEVPGEESLRGDMMDSLSLFPGPNNRPNTVIGNPSILLPEVDPCFGGCLKRFLEKRASSKRAYNK